MDRRIRKTKTAIRNQVALLLQKKELDKITVTEIAQGADINRKSFYNYYSSVQAVIDEIEDDVIAELEEALEDVHPRDAIVEPYIFFEKIEAVISKNLEFYKMLLSGSRSSTLMDKIVDILRDMAFQKKVIEESAGDDKNAALDFYLYGIIRVYQNWFNEIYDLSLKELSGVITDFLRRGPEALLGED